MILRAVASLTTLSHLRHLRKVRATRGEHGTGSKCHGASGEDRSIEVPVGTRVVDARTGEILADLLEPGERWIGARGGRGGQGNARFATATHRAPREATPGEPGEARVVRFELHLLADVGLVGLPNAGKSTLVSRISAARPRIASYPFTTLVPSLGVVDLGGFRTCVVADIPGLIEGAHLGHGLGARFLRHIDRTRLLLHLVDVADPAAPDPVESLRAVREELRAHDPSLLDRPVIVLATKTDALSSPDRLKRLRTWCARRKTPFLAISAQTGAGLDSLLSMIARMLPAPEEGFGDAPRRAFDSP